MSDEEAEVARKARDAMMEGNIYPMGKWLRMQSGFNARLLAEAIENGTLTYDISHAQKTWLNHWLCGRYVVEQLKAGIKSKDVFERAEEKFGMSRRNIERAKAHWLKHGEEELLALQFLAGPLAQDNSSPPKLKKNGGDAQQQPD